MTKNETITELIQTIEKVQRSLHIFEGLIVPTTELLLKRLDKEPETESCHLARILGFAVGQINATEKDYLALVEIYQRLNSAKE